MDIKVSGRTITSSELMLGVRGDNNVESIRFLIPRMTSAGADLSQGIGYAVFRLPSGTDGQVSLTPEVVDDETVAMTLLVGSQMTEERGRGKLALKISGLESVMWSSGICDTFVVNTIDMPSPQPVSLFRAMTVGARIAEPESENPLTVTERTINIPAELQTVAVANDENSETVTIVVPRYFDGQDLSVYDFILHTEMAGNGVDDILFNNQNGQMKSVEDSTVTLTWVLRPPQTSYEGKLSIQLLVQGEEFKWHSLIGELTIAAHITGESVIPNAPSLYEQWAAELQEQVDYVRSQAGNIQDALDNLDSIKDAPAAAERAEAAAEKAQQAAQEALGFRTFFSAIIPDANGNLDPSRPMTTPSAQASWTIESKGDRIQSVQVNGFTQQAGTGDPSPTNVREISTAGLRMVALMYDGSSDESWSATSVNYAFRITLPTAFGGTAYAGYLIYGGTTVASAPDMSFVIASNSLYLIIKSVQTLDALKLYLQENPLPFWFVPSDESQATGLYIPIEAQGHEYRCQMLKLTAPLCDGDKVESCVPSGCDKRIVFDGTKNWQASLNGAGKYRYVLENAASNVAPSDTSNAQRYLSNRYAAVSTTNGSNEGFVLSTTGPVYILDLAYSASNMLEAFKQHLADLYAAGNPVVVYYRSTDYTEQNDIPVQLETHANAIVVVDGADTLFTQGVDGYTVALPGAANGAVICDRFANLTAARNAVTIPASQFPASVTSLEQANTWAQSNPVTILYPLATPAVYARDPVTLVAVPYTAADVAAASQLASTPSTLPSIDSPDVPMLLDAAEPEQATPAVLAANAIPVAGTYVVSSQDGTTVLVSLKAFQDGGDAATLGGQTLEQINASNASTYLTQEQLLTLIYPVGSIYMSANNVSPQTFLGGTWEQIQGQFLLAASDDYPAGSTGGEATHTLTTEEAPEFYNVKYGSASGGSGPCISGAAIFTDGLYSGTVNNTPLNDGGGQPHNNMPPYLAVYMWQRTT